MGCKMGHYFPNWVMHHGVRAGLMSDPLAWLSKYVFSLFAIGGPFLGARSGLKAVLSGDDMGIGDFIGPKNTIRLSRSMGSGMWLYPEGQLRSSSPYSLAYRRDRGTMRIELVSATIGGEGASSSGSLRRASCRLTHTKTTKGGQRVMTVVKTEVQDGAAVEEAEGSLGRQLTSPGGREVGMRPHSDPHPHTAS